MADEPRGRTSEEMRARAPIWSREHYRGTGPTRAKVRLVFRRTNPILETIRTPPCHARVRTRGGILSLDCARTVSRGMASKGMQVKRPGVRASPREGRRVLTKAGGAFRRLALPACS